MSIAMKLSAEAQAVKDVRRSFLLDVAAAALDAVDPVQAVERAVAVEDQMMRVRDRSISLEDVDRCVVLGFGKASVGMGSAVATTLGTLPLTGVLVTNEAHDVPPFEVIEASHPVPDERSVFGGHRLLELAADVRSRDLVVVLISGGGSSLLTVPAPGLLLHDLSETNAVLLRSGAPIGALNTVRKHLSGIKGGRLAEAVAPAAAIVTLVLSDVVGNSLSTIASGPMVPDATSFADALAILAEFQVRDLVPRVVLRHLEAGSRGDIPETPPDGEVFKRQVLAIVGDASIAANAAVEFARASGHRSRVVTSTLEGEAREVASAIVAEAGSLEPGELLVYAGETTVTVRGDGVGGRNQELALAASIAMEGDDGLVLLSLGTDGIDGPNPAAGAFADGASVSRGAAAGLDPRAYLDRNDSHTFLSEIGNTVTCGPTGTNVGDLVVVYRETAAG
jgi:glycerate 2-kinase